MISVALPRGKDVPVKLAWVIEPADAEKFRAFVALHENRPIVRRRTGRNLRDDKPPVQRADIWRQMVACLLTTQQRSGPTSAVTRFIRTDPFPLAYDACVRAHDAEALAKETLKSFGGLRRTGVVAREVGRNLKRLEAGLWQAMLDALEGLWSARGVEAERSAADFVDDNLHGFGPKQARNLLQSLGLTRHAIPIDSRVAKWLNGIGFPIRVSATALLHRSYYTLVEDGIQALCRACEVAPCVLDAAIFASFDGDGWTDENVVW